MKQDSELTRLSSLIERNLPDMSEVHQALLQKGRSVWKAYMDSRLDLVGPNQRQSELQIMLRCCREGLCSFLHYSPDTGGDGIHLPDLIRLRNESNDRYILDANRIERSAKPPLFDHVAKTNARLSKVLTEERESTYEKAIHVLKAFPLSDLSLKLAELLDDIFGEFGFARDDGLDGSYYYTKKIIGSVRFLVGVERVDRFGKFGWDGSFSIRVYLLGVPALQSVDIPAKSSSFKGLPLRLHNLAFGLEYYLSGFLLLNSEQELLNRNPHIIIIKEFDVWDERQQKMALSHIDLGVSCHLQAFSLVEEAITASVREFLV